MLEFLVYDLKVALLLAVFYMFYRLLLSRETFHRINRAVLLLTAVASFVLPLCVITLHQTVVVTGGKGLGTIALGEGMAVVEEPQMPLWQTVAIAVFLAGIALTLGHTLLSLARVWMLISHSEHRPQPDGTVVCISDKEVSPFSWMRYIVLQRKDFVSPDPAIMAHERGHIRQHHSLDVILVDTLTALQWFNPAMWMLRQDLRAIHEYEADAAVLSQGINMRQYQYLLIQKAVADCGYSVVNGISHSTLKNRINMMLHKKSSSASLLKLLALVPIVGIALALNAETVNHYVYEDIQQQPPKKIVKKGRKDAKVKINGQTVEVKAEKAKQTPSRQDMKPVAVGKFEPEKDPLIVINGKLATVEQMKALDPKAIDHVNVIKNEETKRVYAKHFNADTSNGIIFINTKDYVEKGEKELASVEVVTYSEEKHEPFDVVEQMPEYPGGMVELMKFLSENVKYPVVAMKAGTQGRVLVQFIVEKDGTVSEAKVLQKVSDELDAEALRVVNAMPKWKPGKQKGETVRVKYTLPITFRLS